MFLIHGLKSYIWWWIFRSNRCHCFLILFETILAFRIKLVSSFFILWKHLSSSKIIFVSPTSYGHSKNGYFIFPKITTKFILLNFRKENIVFIFRFITSKYSVFNNSDQYWKLRIVYVFFTNTFKYPLKFYMFNTFLFYIFPTICLQLFQDAITLLLNDFIIIHENTLKQAIGSSTSSWETYHYLCLKRVVTFPCAAALNSQ